MKRQCCVLPAGVIAGTAAFSWASAGDNVILFIGDGMGAAHIKAARAFVNGSTATHLSFENLRVTAESVTTLDGGGITDSATAATALATGYQHPANGVISMGANNSIKTTLIEYANAKAMRTAIVTTDDIGGATPGAFGAHEPDRSLMAAIQIGEVVKTVLEDYGMSYMTSMYVIMNKAKWDSISPADQKAIEKINDEYNETIAKRWVELDNAAKEYALGKGVTFVTVSEKEYAATAEKMKPIWDAYVEMTKSKGLPGDEALKFCLDFLKTNP